MTERFDRRTEDTSSRAGYLPKSDDDPNLVNPVKNLPFAFRLFRYSVKISGLRRPEVDGYHKLDNAASLLQIKE